MPIVRYRYHGLSILSSLLLLPLRKAGSLTAARPHPRDAGIGARRCSGVSNTVDTANNLITSHRQCLVGHRLVQIFRDALVIPLLVARP